MTLAEALETVYIHSVAGLTGDRTVVVTTRPFRAPHHTISDVGLIGGGHDFSMKYLAGARPRQNRSCHERDCTGMMPTLLPLHHPIVYYCVELIMVFIGEHLDNGRASLCVPCWSTLWCVILCTRAPCFVPLGFPYP